MEDHRIKHILTMAPGYRPKFVGPPLHINYQVHAEVEDVKSYRLMNVMEEAHAFIAKALEKEEAVFVHCKSGSSRSAAIVMSFLMKHGLPANDAACAGVPIGPLTLDQAFDYCHGLRRNVTIMTFGAQLKAFQEAGCVYG